jgi:ELWxxDGT repeat protein
MIHLGRAMHFIARSLSSGMGAISVNRTSATAVTQETWGNQEHICPTQMTNVNGTLFFTAEDLQYGVELWQGDGTETGTVIVKDIFAGGRSSRSFTIRLTPLVPDRERDLVRTSRT